MLHSVYFRYERFVKMKRRREALFPEINTNHWRITYLSQGRLQIEAAEATGKTNSGCEAEPPPEVSPS